MDVCVSFCLSVGLSVCLSKKPTVASSTRFAISVLDVLSGCFTHTHIALIDDDALATCLYGPVFARALVAWARELQWAHSHAYADTSMTELLVNFIFSAP